MERKNRFTSKLTVRFSDLDAMGHVNNATYFTYMEEARKNFFGEILNATSPEDFPFILASISCNFIKPVQLEEKTLEVDLWITSIGRKSFTFKHAIYRTQDPEWIFATGESVQVFFDHRNHKSIEIPETFKLQIADYASINNMKERSYK